MLTVTLIKSARVSVFGKVLSPTDKTVSIAPHVLFNGLQASQLGRVERGSSFYAELVALLNTSTVKVTDGSTTITTGAGLASYLQSAGGLGEDTPPVAGEVDISAGGEILLTETQLLSKPVVLVGALVADCRVKIPAGTGPCLITNATTGMYATTIEVEDGTDRLYLCQTQTKDFWDYGGEIKSSDPFSFVFRKLVSLIGAVGDHDTDLVRTPAHLSITRCTGQARPGPTGGTSEFSVGDSGSFDQVLARVNVGATGTVIGEEAADLGSAATDLGTVVYPTAQTLTARNHVTVGDITDGAEEITILGIIGGYVQ